MSDWGISSIAPFCRREESSCCSREALEALSPELRRSGGDFSQTEVCSWTEQCGEPKVIPLVDAPIREWNAIEEAEYHAKEDIPELGCREGLDAVTPSASLFGLMESEELDWKVAGTGSVRCRREPTVSPNTWPSGGKRTDCRGERTTRPPTARPKKNED